MKVEFIYDSDCPNVAAARSQLMKAFSKAKLPASWREWDRSAEDSPSYAKSFGSPTILVDGKDVTGENVETGGNCCRIYRGSDGKNAGVPAISLIERALLKGVKIKSNRAKFFAAIPGIGLVMLPKLTCAACWPAYAGIMSSLGIGFFNYTEYLLPITIIALLIALGALLYRAKQRWGYGPFFIGIIASFIMVLGKFVYESNVALYTGVVLIFIASLWNSWPRKSKSCSAC